MGIQTTHALVRHHKTNLIIPMYLESTKDKDFICVHYKGEDGYIFRGRLRTHNTPGDFTFVRSMDKSSMAKAEELRGKLESTHNWYNFYIESLEKEKDKNLYSRNPSNINLSMDFKIASMVLTYKKKVEDLENQIETLGINIDRYYDNLKKYLELECIPQ